MAKAGVAQNIRETDAKYAGVVVNPPGKGYFAEVNPIAHIYVCLDVNGQILVGEMLSWGWNQVFRRVEPGHPMKIRYSDTFIWTTWPDGKVVRFKQDYSQPEVLDLCKKWVQHSK